MTLLFASWAFDRATCRRLLLFRTGPAHHGPLQRQSWDVPRRPGSEATRRLDIIWAAPQFATFTVARADRNAGLSQEQGAFVVARGGI